MDKGFGIDDSETTEDRTGMPSSRLGGGSRVAPFPDPIAWALRAESAGAVGITCHLRQEAFTWSSPPVRIRPCPWPVCALGAS